MSLCKQAHVTSAVWVLQALHYCNSCPEYGSLGKIQVALVKILNKPLEAKTNHHFRNPKVMSLSG